MAINWLSVTVFVTGVLMGYWGVAFLRRPEDVLDHSIHYDSSRMELTPGTRVMTRVAGVLTLATGLMMISFGALLLIA